MKFAIIATSGKQYKVSEGQVVTLERMPEEGKNIAFSNVLLISDGDAVSVGTPSIKGATVKAELVEHGRGEKIRIVKFKAKVRYRRNKGHRQHFTKVRITSIPALTK